MNKPMYECPVCGAWIASWDNDKKKWSYSSDFIDIGYSCKQCLKKTLEFDELLKDLSLENEECY